MQEKLSAKELLMKKFSQGAEASFPKDEYRDRLNRVRAEMARRKIDVLYLSSPESLFYMSGYLSEYYAAQSSKGSVPASGIAVGVDHDHYIFFDKIFEEPLIRLTTFSTDTRIFPGDGPSKLNYIVGELKKEGWLPGTVALEMWSYRPNRAVSLMFQKELEKAGCRVVDGTGIVRELRGVKSPQEIAYVKKAARIADIGMKAAIESMKPGMTEQKIYGEVVRAMSYAEGENPAIPVMVRTRVGGHTLPSRRVIEKGDIIAIDLCGVFNRYHCNLERTFSIGKPQPEVAKVFEFSVKAFDVVSELIRPNLPVVELTERMRTYYEEAGIEELVRWSGGYGLGISFPPDWVGWFRYSAVPYVDPGDRLFVPGTVVNHESLLYLPQGAGSSGIINTLLFDDKQARILSQLSNDLIII